jgi:hypothetical protein
MIDSSLQDKPVLSYSIFNVLLRIIPWNYEKKR